MGGKMKKLAVFVGMLLLISQSSIGSVLAASVGPTSDVATPEGGLLQIPKIGNSPLKAAFVYDYENRDLRPKAGDPKLHVHWFLAKISFDILDRVEPYIELGSAKMSARAPVGTTKDSFDYGASFAWGIGAKVILFKKKVFSSQDKDLQIFSDTKFRRTHTQLDKWIGQGITDGAINAKLLEWQTALGVSQEFKLSKNLTATPYFGGKYSDMDAISKGTAITASGLGINGKSRDQSQYKFGPFVGMDIGIGKYVSLFVEGRFVDENSVSTGITLRI
jgi:hypothetical protein